MTRIGLSTLAPPPPPASLCLNNPHPGALHQWSFTVPTPLLASSVLWAAIRVSNLLPGIRVQGILKTPLGAIP